ncbi:hypothetical protein HPP92_003722 [Vanilla planifolia]|uniref:D-aminoacyl-tRNA deacylase n=1 Tax=Vanilla planifolia TaxID=51239 RepID=A0A835VJP4_VANPL|nr:hypothetical protein HPP92_003722 [Vanilla planifolia]
MKFLLKEVGQAKAALPNPRIGPWFRLLKKIAQEHGLFQSMSCCWAFLQVTLEATHHGPVVSTPTLFLEIGSTEEYWGRQDAAQVIALLLWHGLGLEGGISVGRWDGSNCSKVLLGIGGGHYVPRHMDIVQSMKGWQKNAILCFLSQENIQERFLEWWSLLHRETCTYCIDKGFSRRRSKEQRYMKLHRLRRGPKKLFRLRQLDCMLAS